MFYGFSIFGFAIGVDGQKTVTCPGVGMIVLAIRGDTKAGRLTTKCESERQLGQKVRHAEV